MATLLHGFLNLSRIPKQLITQNSKGEKGIWVDVEERRSPSPYGDTHNVKVWSKETGGVYLASLKPREFGGQQTAAPAPAASAPQAAPQAPSQDSLAPREDDLPF